MRKIISGQLLRPMALGLAAARCCLGTTSVHLLAVDASQTEYIHIKEEQ